MTQVQVVRLELPATHESVRVARHMVRHFARMRSIAERERDILVLVASELLSNAVDHGGGGAAMEDSKEIVQAKMELILRLKPSEWSLEVSDQGGGDANLLQRALDESSLPDLEDDRGRGLFLLRSSVDRMEVQRSSDGKGLCVRAIRAHAAN